MLRKMIICGAVAALLAGMTPVLSTPAQGFVLDPTNSSKNAQGSREAQPAYKGGVVVPYSDSNRGQYGTYNRTPTRTRQPAQPTGPIGYGTMKQRAGQAVSPGLYGNNVGLSPEEQAQQERLARMKAFKDKRKAENAVRAKEYNDKRAAKRQAMMEASSEEGRRNSRSDVNRTNSR